MLNDYVIILQDTAETPLTLQLHEALLRLWSIKIAHNEIESKVVTTKLIKITNFHPFDNVALAANVSLETT